MAEVLFFICHETGIDRLEMDYALHDLQLLSQKPLSRAPKISIHEELMHKKIKELDFLILKTLDSFSKKLSRFYCKGVLVSSSKFLFQTSILEFEEVTEVNYSIISKDSNGILVDSNCGNITLPRLNEHEKMLVLNPLR